jgi:hypothetical protein
MDCACVPAQVRLTPQTLCKLLKRNAAVLIHADILQETLMRNVCGAILRQLFKYLFSASLLAVALLQAR